MYWEEVDEIISHALFHELFDTCAFTLGLLFNVNDEGEIGMKVVLAVNVVFPVDIVNIELGFANATNETLAVDLLLLGSIHVSLSSKRIDNDTEEHVHDNNRDDEEIEEIEDPSATVVVCFSIEGVP